MPKKKKKKTKKKTVTKTAKKKVSKKKAVKKKRKKAGRGSAGPFELTKQHKGFCKEYIIDFNGTRAVMCVSDCTRGSAGVMANRWLDEPKVQEYLAELISKRQERTDLKADEAMKECCRIALADVAGAFNEDGSLKAITDMPLDLRRAISGFEVLEVFEGTGKEKVYVGDLKKVKFWDKVKSLDMLFKHHGLFAKNNEQLPPPKSKTVMVVVVPKTD